MERVKDKEFFMSQRIYYGGNILTMDKDGTSDYLITENGKIKGLGKGTPPPLPVSAERYDLKGRTLMPAFMDPHSHISGCAARFLQVPLESCKTNEEIKSALETFLSQTALKAGEWIFACGYDSGRIKGRRLTAEFLDKIVPEHPLVVQYQSGHMGIFNSAAMKILGVDKNTPSAEGGFIEKAEDGTPTGYMEEADFVSRLKNIPMPGGEKLLNAFTRAQKLYFSHGIVTAQEGLAAKELLPLYRALDEADKLLMDVVLYPDIHAFGAYSAAFPGRVKNYKRHLKIGGIKLISDGSPQGRTAWMRSPYLDESGKPASDGYAGFPSVTQEELESAVRFSAERKLQLLAHCNGDMAAERFIEAEENYGDPATRPVMIHAQFLGLDQLDRVKRAGILPSFFVAHVLHWGEIHIRNLGLQRASKMSPLRSALERNMHFTLHQDSPVILPDMLETIYCAVSRKTETGRILGEDERIDACSALRAVTAEVAYQYFEENETGTLSEGKRENLIILSENPVGCPEEKLREIRVEETIRDGETVFKL